MQVIFKTCSTLTSTAAARVGVRSTFPLHTTQCTFFWNLGAMARSVHHWITSHSHSRKQSSQSMHFMSTQKRCETTPKAAKYDLVLKQNMLLKISCNNHNSKSYAVKRLSTWIEAGWKSWRSPSANRLGIFESYPKTRLQSKISAEKIEIVCTRPSMSQIWKTCNNIFRSSSPCLLYTSDAADE